MILQLGYILLSVPAWKKAFRLRVLVFVEYEAEIEDERRRLKALLEKLRIEAEIVAFALASGQLKTYEYIINGDVSQPDTTYIVDDLLKDDEWWIELQRLRNEVSQVSPSHEFASLGAMLEETRRRHSDSQHSEDDRTARRLSVHDLLDLPKNPTVSRISKLGVNFGIHTHRLSPVAFDDPNNTGPSYSSDDDSESITSSDADFNDVASLASGHSFEESGRTQRRSVSRRKSLGDIITGRTSTSDSMPLLHPSTAAASSGYGAISSESALPVTDRRPGPAPTESSRRTASSVPLLEPLTESRESSDMSTLSPTVAPTRPSLTRHSSASRFTSNLTPDTKITVEEGSGPKIMFTEAGTSSPATKPPTRPVLSRNSSMSKFSSRPVPETRIEDEGGGAGPRLTFAQPEDYPLPATPLLRSRRNSASRGSGQGQGQGQGQASAGDAHVNIPEMLESYRFGSAAAAAASARAGEDEEGGSSHHSNDNGSSYSTQNLPLSFNDLPSRAQHLILNELMRQNSTTSDTAVLLTTLPIPEEGTCHSEEDSLRYLADIEVRCHELPPVLLVLSNNMTVTVSL